MPIQFRCGYCHQLLGIARRKAGTVISCPTCNGRVIVPHPPAPEPAPGRVSSEPPVPLLERSDIEVLLRPPAAGQPVVPHDPGTEAAVPSPSPRAAPDPVLSPAAPAAEGPLRQIDVEPVPGLSRPAEGAIQVQDRSIVLTPGRATIITVIIVLLLGLAFVAGIALARYLWS